VCCSKFAVLLLLLLWLLASTYSGYISLNRVAISPIARSSYNNDGAPAS
jgi:hypothetical protein